MESRPGGNGFIFHSLWAALLFSNDTRLAIKGLKITQQSWRAAQNLWKLRLVHNGWISFSTAFPFIFFLNERGKSWCAEGKSTMDEPFVSFSFPTFLRTYLSMSRDSCWKDVNVRRKVKENWETRRLAHLIVSSPSALFYPANLEEPKEKKEIRSEVGGPYDSCTISLLQISFGLEKDN